MDKWLTKSSLITRVNVKEAEYDSLTFCRVSSSMAEAIASSSPIMIPFKGPRTTEVVSIHKDTESAECIRTSCTSVYEQGVCQLSS